MEVIHNAGKLLIILVIIGSFLWQISLGICPVP